MKDAADPGAVELPLPVKRGRGRPRKPDALSPAERQRRYRARRAGIASRAVEIAKGDAYMWQGRLCDQEEENTRLVAERGAAYAEIDRLNAELAAKRGSSSSSLSDYYKPGHDAACKAVGVLRCYLESRGALPRRKARYVLQMLELALGLDS